MSESPLNRRFIVLEGGEGSGKSTLAAALGARFAAEGREVVLTREPGGTPAGELVRKLLHEPLTPWAEAFAFFVARAQLVSDVIRPALERGAAVVCDRFAASTYAYQAYARGLDLGELRAANAAATGGLEPGLTLFLDLEVGAGLTRKLGEDEAIRTGLESVEFHWKVRGGYLAQMAEAPAGSWVRIDATLSRDEVASAAWAAITGA
ncbi:MAG TPA: dTMP kinase [Tepidiformaceae bacterium]